MPFERYDDGEKIDLSEGFVGAGWIITKHISGDLFEITTICHYKDETEEEEKKLIYVQE